MPDKTIEQQATFEFYPPFFKPDALESGPEFVSEFAAELEKHSNEKDFKLDDYSRALHLSPRQFSRKAKNSQEKRQDIV